MKFFILSFLALLSLGMSAPLESDVSMDRVLDVFAKFHSQIIELEKSMSVFSERVSISTGNKGIVTRAQAFVTDKSKAMRVNRMLDKYTAQSQAYFEYLQLLKGNIWRFINLLTMKDVKPELRQEIVDQLPFEYELLHAQIEEFDSILESEKMKAIEADRKSIEADIFLLHLYLTRYEKDRQTSVQLANQQTEVLNDVVVAAMERFDEEGGPIESIKILTYGIKVHLEDLSVIIAKAVKNLIPRA